MFILLVTACPGSVAAYHEALSRLRLGFKFRPGRHYFSDFLSDNDNAYILNRSNWHNV